MNSTKYIGMDVHKEATSIAVMNAAGKLVTGVGGVCRGARARAEPAAAGPLAS